MNTDDYYGGKYLKCSDLQGRSVTAKIARVAAEEMGQKKDRKLVVYLAGSKGDEKGVVLNKTRLKPIVTAYGKETEDWVGQKITLFPSQTTFQGDIVDCIGIKVPDVQIDPRGLIKEAAKNRQMAPADEGMDDDIPF